MTEHDHAPLTAAGAARRDRMLDELLGTMRAHHSRRRRRREVGALAALAVVTALVTLAAMPPLRRTAVVERPAPAPPTALVAQPAPTPRAVVELVRTDPDILERYAARPADRAERLADDELLAELEAVDRPAGLIRRGGRVWLTAEVTGPAARPSPPASSM